MPPVQMSPSPVPLDVSRFRENRSVRQGTGRLPENNAVGSLFPAQPSPQGAHQLTMGLLMKGLEGQSRPILQKWDALFEKRPLHVLQSTPKGCEALKNYGDFLEDVQKNAQPPFVSPAFLGEILARRQTLEKRFSPPKASQGPVSSPSFLPTGKIQFRFPTPDIGGVALPPSTQIYSQYPVYKDIAQKLQAWSQTVKPNNGYKWEAWAEVFFDDEVHNPLRDAKVEGTLVHYGPHPLQLQFIDDLTSHPFLGEENVWETLQKTRHFRPVMEKVITSLEDYQKSPQYKYSSEYEKNLIERVCQKFAVIEPTPSGEEAKK